MSNPSPSVYPSGVRAELAELEAEFRHAVALILVHPDPRIPYTQDQRVAYEKCLELMRQAGVLVRFNVPSEIRQVILNDLLEAALEDGLSADEFMTQHSVVGAEIDCDQPWYGKFDTPFPVL